MRNNFKPIKIIKARKALEKHLLVVESHAQTNKDYKKGVLKGPSLWQRISLWFKREIL